MRQSTIISSNQVEATLGGCQFGTGFVDENVFTHDVPEALRVLAINLNEQSMLLALQPSNELQKRQVYDAYRNDLQLLENRISDFEDCVKLAVRCATLARRSESEEKAREEANRLWEEIKKEIPPIGKKPLLSLDHILAAKPAVEILETLKQRFEQSVSDTLRLFICWLQLLVDHEFVGLVEWSDLDVARYHYFVHDRRYEVVKEQAGHESVVDPSKDFGEQTTITEFRDQTIRTRRYLERHVHHIVDARIHDLIDYPAPVPARVRDFLEGIPQWLRPLLQIVSGDITTEEIIRRKTRDETSVESEITSVWKGSPAVTLGNFALIGWNDDDVRDSCNGTYYACQKVRNEVMSKQVRQTTLMAVAMVTVISIVVWGIWYGVDQSHAKAFAAQQAYAQSLGRMEIIETKRGEALPLKGEQIPICFAGIAYNHQPSSGNVLLSRVKENQDRLGSFSHLFSIEKGWDTSYGEIDLASQFGVFAKLHVVSITKDSIKYGLTYYGIAAEKNE